MKKPGSKFWGVVALSFGSLIIIFISSAFWFKYQLTPAELKFFVQLIRQYIGPLLIILLLLVVVCVWTVEAVFRNYIRPVPKITEKVALINTSNPSYRISGAGSAEIRQLCERFG